MNKTFDAVQWMRQRRAQIDDEDRDLSWDQKRLKTRQVIKQDPLLASLSGRVLSPGMLHPLAVKEP